GDGRAARGADGGGGILRRLRGARQRGQVLASLAHRRFARAARRKPGLVGSRRRRRRSGRRAWLGDRRPQRPSRGARRLPSRGESAREGDEDHRRVAARSRVAIADPHEYARRKVRRGREEYPRRAVLSHWLAVQAETDPLSRARELQRSWERLVADGALGLELPAGATAGLRPTIVDSWRRS